MQRARRRRRRHAHLALLLIEPAAPRAGPRRHIGVEIDAQSLIGMPSPHAAHEIIVDHGDAQPRGGRVKPAQHRPLACLAIPLVGIGQPRPALGAIIADADERRGLTCTPTALPVTTPPERRVGLGHRHDCWLFAHGDHRPLGTPERKPAGRDEPERYGLQLIASPHMPMLPPPEW